MVLNEKYSDSPIFPENLLPYDMVSIDLGLFLLPGPIPPRREMEKFRRTSRIHIVLKDRAIPTDLHFAAPAFPFPSLTDGSINKPAEVADPELPCRAGLPLLPRAFKDFPAGAKFSARLLLHRQQEEHLPFGMDRDLSPALLKGLDRPDGYSQQLSQGALRFFEFLAGR